MIALLWIIILALGIPAFAQESFTARVDRNTVRVGDIVTLTLEFNGAGSGVPQPTFPPFEKLQMAGGPMTSSSLSIVNGRASSSASFSYSLRAIEAGQGKIGAAQLKFKGKVYTANPITIEIVAGGAAPQGASGGKAGGKGTADVFMRVNADKTNAYVGEQITLSYKIYFAAQITNPDVERLPRATGFWVEDIPLPQQLVLSDEVVGGRAYKVATIRKSALFPTSSGDLDVEPMVIGTKIARSGQRRMRDPFDIFNDPFFMGTQYEPIELQCPSLTLHVRALPGGAPAGFNGAVGSYKLSAAFDRVNCKTDEGVTLTVNIEGTGNIKTLPEPSISFPPDIQKYDPESSDDIRRNGPRITGVKTFKYVVIARAPGQQVIPPISYVYFDPDKQSYFTLAANDLRLQVEKGTGTASLPSGISVAAKHGVENIGTDIAFAKIQPGTFVDFHAFPHQGAGFWILGAAPWTALAGALIVLRRKEREGAARAGRRNALNKAARALTLAEKAEKSSKPEVVFGHISVALENVLLAIVGESALSMSPTELEELWRDCQYDPELLKKLHLVQSECDRARFAPSSVSKDSVRFVVGQTKDILALSNRVQTKAEAS